jgi:hypothetical protein
MEAIPYYQLLPLAAVRHRSIPRQAMLELKAVSAVTEILVAWVQPMVDPVATLEIAK